MDPSGDVDMDNVAVLPVLSKDADGFDSDLPRPSRLSVSLCVPHAARTNSNLVIPVHMCTLMQ